jgi:hypothetical protein
VAIAVVNGQGSTPVPAATKLLHFSGYDWIVRTAASNRSGTRNSFDPANAWTDERGALRLRIAKSQGKWTCAEVKLTRSRPGAPVPPILPPQDGYLFLDRAKFPASFAADVGPGTARILGRFPSPMGLDALNGTISEPAWKTKPSWYLVAAEDKMIPPDAQRAMSKRCRRNRCRD